MTPRRRGLKAAAPQVDVLVQSSQWKREAKIATHLRKAIAAAAARLSEKDAPKPAIRSPGHAGNAALVLALSDDAALRALNRDWRGQDKPTNVLSFPAPPGENPPGAPVHWGDVIIAYETTAREAQEGGKPFTDHAAHLAIHGFLHLAGYDHEKDTDAEVMEALERAILARIDIPDPYSS